jgi:LysR family transcriptional regulator, regulator of abg operon
VEPTDYGKVFNQRAQIVIDELRKAQEGVFQLRGKLEGSLTVAIAPASTMQIAPMVFKDFRARCPGVKLHIVEGIWPSLCGQVIHWLRQPRCGI